MSLAVEVAAGAGFALAWALSWKDCAPPVVTCVFPGNACVTLCVNAWSQWPMTFPFGLVLGIPAAAMAFVLLSTVPMRPRLAVLSAASVLLMGAGPDLVVLSPRGFLGDPTPWVVIVAAAALFLGTLFLGRHGHEPSSRWP